MASLSVPASAADAQQQQQPSSSPSSSPSSRPRRPSAAPSSAHSLGASAPSAGAAGSSPVPHARSMSTFFSLAPVEGSSASGGRAHTSASSASAAQQRGASDSAAASIAVGRSSVVVAPSSSDTASKGSSSSNAKAPPPPIYLPRADALYLHRQLQIYHRDHSTTAHFAHVPSLALPHPSLVLEDVASNFSKTQKQGPHILWQIFEFLRLPKPDSGPALIAATTTAGAAQGGKRAAAAAAAAAAGQQGLDLTAAGARSVGAAAVAALVAAQDAELARAGLLERSRCSGAPPVALPPGAGKAAQAAAAQAREHARPLAADEVRPLALPDHARADAALTPPPPTGPKSLYSPPPTLGLTDVSIPHTVVIEDGSLAHWYFTTTGEDGRAPANVVRRKKTVNTTADNVVATFLAAEQSKRITPWQSAREIDIVATFYPRSVSSLHSVVPVFLSREQLGRFVRERAPRMRLSGVLQSFVAPAGSHNRLLRAEWTPAGCSVIERIAGLPLEHPKSRGKGNDVDSRMATFERNWQAPLHEGALLVDANWTEKERQRHEEHYLDLMLAGTLAGAAEKSSGILSNNNSHKGGNDREHKESTGLFPPIASASHSSSSAPNASTPTTVPTQHLVTTHLYNEHRIQQLDCLNPSWVQSISSICWSVARHLKEVLVRHIKGSPNPGIESVKPVLPVKMTLYFKVGAGNRLFLLFADEFLASQGNQTLLAQFEREMNDPRRFAALGEEVAAAFGAPPLPLGKGAAGKHKHTTSSMAGASSNAAAASSTSSSSAISRSGGGGTPAESEHDGAGEEPDVSSSDAKSGGGGARKKSRSVAGSPASTAVGGGSLHVSTALKEHGNSSSSSSSSSSATKRAPFRANMALREWLRYAWSHQVGEHEWQRSAALIDMHREAAKIEGTARGAGIGTPLSSSVAAGDNLTPASAAIQSPNARVRLLQTDSRSFSSRSGNKVVSLPSNSIFQRLAKESASEAQGRAIRARMVEFASVSENERPGTVHACQACHHSFTLGPASILSDQKLSLFQVLPRMVAQSVGLDSSHQVAGSSSSVVAPVSSGREGGGATSPQRQSHAERAAKTAVAALAWGSSLATFFPRLSEKKAQALLRDRAWLENTRVVLCEICMQEVRGGPLPMDSITPIADSQQPTHSHNQSHSSINPSAAAASATSQISLSLHNSAPPLPLPDLSEEVLAVVEDALRDFLGLPPSVGIFVEPDASGATPSSPVPGSGAASQLTGLPSQLVTADEASELEEGEMNPIRQAALQGAQRGLRMSQGLVAAQDAQELPADATPASPLLTPNGTAVPNEWERVQQAKRDRRATRRDHRAEAAAAASRRERHARIEAEAMRARAHALGLPEPEIVQIEAVEAPDAVVGAATTLAKALVQAQQTSSTVTSPVPAAGTRSLAPAAAAGSSDASTGVSHARSPTALSIMTTSSTAAEGIATSPVPVHDRSVSGGASSDIEDESKQYPRHTHRQSEPSLAAYHREQEFLRSLAAAAAAQAHANHPLSPQASAQGAGTGIAPSWPFLRNSRARAREAAARAAQRMEREFRHAEEEAQREHEKKLKLEGTPESRAARAEKFALQREQRLRDHEAAAAAASLAAEDAQRAAEAQARHDALLASQAARRAARTPLERVPFPMLAAAGATPAFPPPEIIALYVKEQGLPESYLDAYAKSYEIFLKDAVEAAAAKEKNAASAAVAAAEKREQRSQHVSPSRAGTQRGKMHSSASSPALPSIVSQRSSRPHHGAHSSAMPLWDDRIPGGNAPPPSLPPAEAPPPSGMPRDPKVRIRGGGGRLRDEHDDEAEKLMAEALEAQEKDHAAQARGRNQKDQRELTAAELLAAPAPPIAPNHSLFQAYSVSLNKKPRDARPHSSSTQPLAPHSERGASASSDGGAADASLLSYATNTTLTHKDKPRRVRRSGHAPGASGTDSDGGYESGPGGESAAAGAVPPKPSHPPAGLPYAIELRAYMAKKHANKSVGRLASGEKRRRSLAAAAKEKDAGEHKEPPPPAEAPVKIPAAASASPATKARTTPSKKSSSRKAGAAPAAPAPASAAPETEEEKDGSDQPSAPPSEAVAVPTVASMLSAASGSSSSTKKKQQVQVVRGSSVDAAAAVAALSAEDQLALEQTAAAQELVQQFQERRVDVWADLLASLDASAVLELVRVTSSLVDSGAESSRRDPLAARTLALLTALYGAQVAEIATPEQLLRAVRDKARVHNLVHAPQTSVSTAPKATSQQPPAEPAAVAAE